MTHPELPPEDGHPRTLLPWYLTETLGPTERAQVHAHLEHCAECQAELASLRDVREQVREAFTEPAVAPESARRRVMERVRRTSVERHDANRRLALDRFADFFRQLLAPKWAPAGAVALIALQVGVLMWAVQEPAGRPQVTERAHSHGRKLERLAAADPRLLVVRSRSDLEALAQRRREDPEVLGALLGIEGANALDGDLASLDRLFAAGLRLVGLAHFFDNEFAGSAHGLEKGGLTDLGRRLVAEIGRRGLVLDLAHSSEATFRDALALARRPPVVSHTGVKGTCPNPRNLSDDQVRAVAAAGGVIGIGYWETAVCGTGIADIVRAMRHVALLVGDDHVGLGSDFDGAVATPFDTAGLASLTQALLDGGFEDDSVRKILGENALRVIGESLPR